MELRHVSGGGGSRGRAVTPFLPPYFEARTTAPRNVKGDGEDQTEEGGASTVAKRTATADDEKWWREEEEEGIYTA